MAEMLDTSKIYGRNAWYFVKYMAEMLDIS